MTGAAAGPGRIAIRRAGPGEAGLVLALVTELAEYERLAHEVAATEADFAAAVGGPAPRVFAELLEIDGETAGTAIWFYSFSTFVGRHGIYLEDLYVRPAYRRRGLARAALAHLAGIARREGLGRLEWAVLDWNAPAIAFYREIGAVPMDGWTTMRVTGPPLARLAGEAGGGG